MHLPFHWNLFRVFNGFFAAVYGCLLVFERGAKSPIMSLTLPKFLNSRQHRAIGRLFKFLLHVLQSLVPIRCGDDIQGNPP
jgi:hypothetical protein